MQEMRAATSNRGLVSAGSAWEAARLPTCRAFIFQTFSINQLKCWQQHGKMFNSLLSSGGGGGGSLRLHLADKGACVSLLDPASPARLTGAERKLYLGRT